MGREHETRVVALRDEERIKALDPAYRYKAAGKLPWLQRLCFRLLDRLAPAEPMWTAEIRFTRTNVERVLDRVQDQFQVVARRNGDRPPTRLVIGARDWAELTRDPELPFYLEGRGTYLVSNLRQGYQNRVMGLHVEIVPWMRGIVVLP